MKNQRRETTSALDGKDVTVETGTEEKFDLIRRARERQGISLRELARRSGVSAGQLSRIETGEVEKPSVDTLKAIADALGRPQASLLLLAGHVLMQDFEELAESLTDEIDGISSWADEFAYETDPEKRAVILWDLADHNLAPAGIAPDLWRKIRRDMSEIAAAWQSLTPERRQLVLAFVADQEVLSRLDRMPTPPGRYEFDLTLRVRDANNGVESSSKARDGHA